jgi:hypothetical protein
VSSRRKKSPNTTNIAPNGWCLRLGMGRKGDKNLIKMLMCKFTRRKIVITLHFIMNMLDHTIF